MQLSLTIDSNNLDLAASQLWNFLHPELNYLSQKECKLVHLAFSEMVVAHNLQRRKSGEFYIIHPVQACHTLAQMKLDGDTLSACLLHDVPEDTQVSLEDLGKIFKPEIIFLVSGVTKLSAIKYQENDIYAKNLRRLFLAMSQDLRVILIKLADRIHNLTTLSALPPEKSKRIALESLKIYAPIAEKFGINWMSCLIQEYALPYAYPDSNYVEKNDKQNQADRDLYYKYGIALLWSKKLISSSQKKVISEKLSKTSLPWLDKIVSLGDENLSEDIYLEKLLLDLNINFA